MIMRIFLIAGLLLLGGTAYFVVGQKPPTVQAAPVASNVTVLQTAGLLPTGPLAENEEIEHDIFGVPPEDEVMLERATANAEAGGMNMGGMNMTPEAGTAAPGTMTMPDGTTMPMGDMATAPEAGTAAPGTMAMPGGTTAPMGNMATAPEAGAAAPGTMTMPDGTTMPMSDMAAAPEAGAAAPGAMAMPGGTAMPMGDMATSLPEAEGGLAFATEGSFDREITLAMQEWGFSDLNIAVTKGERIRFTVRNAGNIPHEFMFMTMPAMQAVTYRARRADWNLLEHEALFEQSLLLPGGETSFIVEVQQSGAWMFMCMLPYHMQMGMMGQMATEGMAMQMEM